MLVTHARNLYKFLKQETCIKNLMQVSLQEVSCTSVTGIMPILSTCCSINATYNGTLQANGVERAHG